MDMSSVNSDIIRGNVTTIILNTLLQKTVATDMTF